MVEFHNDVVGNSSIFTGGKQQEWKRLIDYVDGLVDDYLCDSIRKGPFHTKQAWYLDKVDQSHLDWSYASNRVGW